VHESVLDAVDGSSTGHESAMRRHVRWFHAPNGKVIPAVAVLCRWNIVEMATIGRDGCTGVQAVSVPGRPLMMHDRSGAGRKDDRRSLPVEPSSQS
jgi:hypothetical protein